MRTINAFVALLAFITLTATAAAPSAVAGQTTAEDAQIRDLLRRVEVAAATHDRNGYLQLLGSEANRAAAYRFLDTEFRPGIGRIVVQERDRVRLPGSLPGNGYALTTDAFIETNDRARIATWEFAIRRGDDSTWHIIEQRMASSIENLHRLSLNTAQQFDVRNFTVVAEDIELTLVEGSVFTIDTEQGTTGLVLMGRGDMRFHPTPRTEIEQVRIFGGGEALESRFDAAFVRVGAFEAHADRNLLMPRAAVDPRDVRRAQQIFREESAKSFVLDLADLSRDVWSLLPGPEDFLAEIRTRRFDTLTYSRSTSEAEDISFFDRKRHRNIAAYASKDKMQARGRFYNEDDLSPFDVLDYEIDVNYIPERLWLDGKATMHVRVRAASLGQLTLRLADSLTVQSITSDRFGRLFNLRVSNQNTVLVNLPRSLTQDENITVHVHYAGRLEPQASEREVIAPQRDQYAPIEGLRDTSGLPTVEPSFLYSNRSYWHPQPMITDYATATIRVTVPGSFAVVASGTPADSPSPSAGVPATRVFEFNAERPLRYLAFLVSKLSRAGRSSVRFDQAAVTPNGTDTSAPTIDAAVYDRLDIIISAQSSQAGKAKAIGERAADVVQFYESLIGDSPYATFDIALIESLLPGGHSPGYFAALNQPLTTTGITWRNDPAAFSSYPEFFLAHETAHQWWGQAVGWRNYHEQWLSEGFAQYFAALYAQYHRGDEVFADVLKQMSRWAVDESDQGPVYLGYRVGHIKSDGRAFRAIIYNKGALLLHMLRLLVGDEVFFKGVRRFYNESRFAKVGSDDFRRAMETESGQPLDRFFERWVYNSTLPELMVSHRVETGAKGQEVVLHFEQGDEIFDFPVVVTLQLTSRREVNVVVPITNKIVDFRVPFEGTLRAVEINRSTGGLVNVSRN